MENGSVCCFLLRTRSSSSSRRISAHGFLVLSDHAEFAYKCTDFYHPNDEGGLSWRDPDLNVQWPIPEGMELTISEKDHKWGGIKELKK